jgi:uncharacterized membrane protein
MKSSPEIRPVLKLPLTAIDYALEATAILGIISLCVLAVVSYSSLPDSIPTHFNLKGQADDWGSKASIFILPGISLLLFTGITILNKFPHIFNYPVKVTGENALRLYTKSVRVVRILKALVVMLFLFIEWQVCRSAENAELPSWFFPAVLIIPVLLPIVMTLFLTKTFSSGKRK